MVSCTDSFVQKDFADAQRDKQVNMGHWVFLEYMYSTALNICNEVILLLIDIRRRNKALLIIDCKIVWDNQSTNTWILGRVPGIPRRFWRGVHV